MLAVGDLFSGIGGFSLAARRMGWRTAWFSEVDPWAIRVLAKNFPEVPNLGDISAIDFARVRPVDVITAGFPCTDISLAGKGAGITGQHSGLWTYAAGAIRSLRPRYVVVENVGQLINNGIDTVLGDLAALGYDAWWDVRDAAASGSPQRRERVFITAWREWEPAYGVEDFDRCESCDDAWCPRCDVHAYACPCATEIELDGSGDWRIADEPWGVVAYPVRERGRGGESAGEYAVYADPRGQADLASGAGSWWTTGPTVCGVAHGLRGRMDRLRGLGNSIVPQEAMRCFQWISARESAIYGDTLPSHSS